MAAPRFVIDFEPMYGEMVEVSPLLRRLVCKNPSKFTFHGTGTYVIGRGDVAVVDPGPRDDDHATSISPKRAPECYALLMPGFTCPVDDIWLGKVEDPAGCSFKAQKYLDAQNLKEAVVEAAVRTRDGTPTRYCGYKMVGDDEEHTATRALLERTAEFAPQPPLATVRYQPQSQNTVGSK